MKKLFLLASAVTLLGAVAVTASADNLKIGVIDLQQVVQNSPQIIRMQAELKKQFSPRDAALTKVVQTLQSDMSTLNRDGAVMKAVDHTALKAKIDKEKQSFQNEQGNCLTMTP